MPIKKKSATNPIAMNVPNIEAKKLLKKFISFYFNPNIGFVDLIHEIYTEYSNGESIHFTGIQ
jgi:hypothetical protein